MKCHKEFVSAQAPAAKSCVENLAVSVWTRFAGFLWLSAIGGEAASK